MPSAKSKHELCVITGCDSCPTRRQSRPNANSLQQNVQQETKDAGHVHKDFPSLHARQSNDLHSVEYARPALLSAQRRYRQQDVEHRSNPHSQDGLHEGVHRVYAQDCEHAHPEMISEVTSVISLHGSLSSNNRLEVGMHGACP